MRDWQPIDTAPQDGTQILAVNEYGDMRVVEWETHYGGEPGEWRVPDGYPVHTLTHWMPLPSVEVKGQVNAEVEGLPTGTYTHIRKQPDGSLFFKRIDGQWFEGTLNNQS